MAAVEQKRQGRRPENFLPSSKQSQAHVGLPLTNETHLFEEKKKRTAEYFYLLRTVRRQRSGAGYIRGPSQRLRFRVHQLLHHQVYVDDGAEVQSPVEEAVAHELRDKRPQEGECESLREHLP